MAVSWPDHLLSLEEWASLPPDSTRRFELVEGVLLVTPRPALLHQRAMIRLATALDVQLPAALCAVGDVEVVIDAGDALAVEILSPGTRTTDRVTKTFQYAAAGIPPTG